MNFRMLIAMAVLALFACGESDEHSKSASDEKNHDQKGHEGEEQKGDEHKEEKEHSGEVHMSAEALKRSEIQVGKVERRVHGGGVAVPAEVQFDPNSTAHVGSLVPGRFTSVEVALGDAVKRGQLLGVVASGDVSATRAKLDQTKARLTAAESALSRQRQLASEGIGAKRTLVEAEAEVSDLRAEVQGAQGQLAVLGSGGGGGQLRLVAPIDGVVVQIHATLGETASPDEPAFVVTDPARVSVRGNVPELEIAKIKSGMRVAVRLHAFPDLRLTGSISYVAPMLDEQTRSLPIRVSLDTADARLRSGLFGAIELLGGADDQRVLTVPVDAVAMVDGQTVVFTPADEPNAFKPTVVTLGRRAGAFYEVAEGLTEGTLIATTGAFVLKSVLKSGEMSEGHEH